MENFLMLGKASKARVWQPRGWALEASAAGEELACQEPNVLYDGGLWKLWYSAGWNHAARHIYYATSSDGLNFTRYAGNPVVSGYTRCMVFKDGGTFYMYAIDEAGGTGYHQLSSADGIAWTNNGVISLTGSAGAWEGSGVANIHVWKEGATWYMIYDGFDGVTYKLGLATGATGLSFARYSTSPVINNLAGMVGGPWIYKDSSGLYTCWLHISTNGLLLPTDIARYQSRDLVNWRRNPAGRLAVPRTDADDNVLGAAGQTADPSLVEVAGTTYLYGTATYNGGIAAAGIKVYTAAMTLAQLAKAGEGIKGGFLGSYLMNGGFERTAAGAADTFEKWTKTVSDGAIARSGAAGEFRSGTSGLYSAKLTAGASVNTQIVETIGAGFYPFGARMTLTGWARGDGTNRGRCRIFGVADLVADWNASAYLTNSTTWTQFSMSFTAPASGSFNVFCYCPSVNGGVAYFDDLKLIAGG